MLLATRAGSRQGVDFDAGAARTPFSGKGASCAGLARRRAAPPRREASFPDATWQLASQAPARHSPHSRRTSRPGGAARCVHEAVIQRLRATSCTVCRTMWTTLGGRMSAMCAASASQGSSTADLCVSCATVEENVQVREPIQGNPVVRASTRLSTFVCGPSCGNTRTFVWTRLWTAVWTESTRTSDGRDAAS